MHAAPTFSTNTRIQPWATIRRNSHMAGSLILYQSIEQHVRGGWKRWGGGVGWSRGGGRSWRRSRCGCQQQVRNGLCISSAYSCMSSSERKCIRTTAGSSNSVTCPTSWWLNPLMCLTMRPLLKVGWVTVEAVSGDWWLEFLNCSGSVCQALMAS